MSTTKTLEVTILYPLLLWLVQMTDRASSISCLQCVFAESANVAVSGIINAFKGDDFLRACENYQDGNRVTCAEGQICNYQAFTISVKTHFFGLAENLLGSVTVARKRCSAPPEELDRRNNCKRLVDHGGLERLGIEFLRSILGVFVRIDVPDFRDCFCDTEGCDPSCGQDSIVLFGQCFSPLQVYGAFGTTLTLLLAVICCIRCCFRCCCCKCCRRKKDYKMRTTTMTTEKDRAPNDKSNGKVSSKKPPLICFTRQRNETFQLYSIKLDQLKPSRLADKSRR